MFRLPLIRHGVFAVRNGSSDDGTGRWESEAQDGADCGKEAAEQEEYEENDAKHAKVVSDLFSKWDVPL